MAQIENQQSWLFLHFFDIFGWLSLHNASLLHLMYKCWKWMLALVWRWPPRTMTQHLSAWFCPGVAMNHSGGLVKAGQNLFTIRLDFYYSFLSTSYSDSIKRMLEIIFPCLIKGKSIWTSEIMIYCDFEFLHEALVRRRHLGWWSSLPCASDFRVDILEVSEHYLLSRNQLVSRLLKWSESWLVRCFVKDMYQTFANKCPAPVWCPQWCFH